MGTGPYLEDELDGVAINNDSDIGRPSGVGVAILQSLIAPDDEVVVFDLGTNDDPGDPDALAEDLAAARSIAGSPLHGDRDAQPPAAQRRPCRRPQPRRDLVRTS